jgi:RNA polymerase sigma-70 factor (ECF subfamily)
VSQFPPTAPSLLLRMRDTTDTLAWDQFVELYSPLIYRFARQRGLQDADAADLMQNVLSAVSQVIGRFDYEPSRGSFRSWLFTIVRNQLASQAKRRARHPEERTSPASDLLSGTSGARNDPNDGEAEQIWQREYQLRLLQWGLDQIRSQFEENTWRAFMLTAIERRPARDVGADLGMSPGAVYIAKSRVRDRLKEFLQGIDGESVLATDQ